MFDPETLDLIAATCGYRQYRRGEIIFRAGDRPDGIYCVHDGRVKLYRIGPDSREQILRLAGPGDLLDYRSLISSQAYSSSASPIQSSHLCHIPADTFLMLLATSEQLALRLIKLLTAELTIAEQKIVDLAQSGVGVRLAELLLSLTKTYGFEEDGMTIKGKVTRLELAALIGAAMESASRELAKLKRQGAIDLVGRRIRILDMEALRRVRDGRE